MNENWIDGPLQPILSPDEVHVWQVELLQSDNQLLELRDILSEEEKKRADRFKFEIHRKRFIAAKGVLRNILARYLNISPKQIEFSYGEHGKPFLAAKNDSQLFFNSSDSQDLAIYAISQQEVGIDIEYIRDDFNPMEIANRFFCDEEKVVLANIPAQRRQRAFFNCWACKEAYLKYIGQGLAFSMDQFCVKIECLKSPQILYLNNSELQKPGLIYDLPVSLEYAAALAVGESIKFSCFCFK